MICELLLKAGANIESAHHQMRGATPLMISTYDVRNRHDEPAKLKTLEVLLKFKADVNAVGNDGFTALLLAAQNSYPTLCEALIKAGANVHERESDCHSTALILAAQNVDGEPVAEKDDKALVIVTLLLAAGADAAAVNGKGHTALSCAQANGLMLTATALKMWLGGLTEA